MQVLEREESGRSIRTRIARNHQVSRVCEQGNTRTSFSLLGLASKVFLPAGYPRSVTPDYLRYQTLNALQAFCSSLAGLLSSRATLEGYGVGNASASATNALLLTVFQDIFGRLTTIVAAFFFGSSLFPEAKTYRFLADVLNDAAIILDTLSPLLSTLLTTHAPPISLPFLPPRVPLQVYTLCISASFRALCGIVAGGSKTAITMHFATPLEGSGDVGDLNAKDASKETVLALFGMLMGTAIVPYLTTPWSTYSVLFVLVFLHLTINYLAVKGIVLRSLNRQRASIAWIQFRRSSAASVNTPSEIASLERIFDRPELIRNETRNTILGRCIIGSSLNSCIINTQLFNIFSDERYILSFEPTCISSSASSPSSEIPSLRPGTKPDLRIILKEGFTSSDQLKAWLHACEVSRMIQTNTRGSNGAPLDLLGVVEDALREINELFPTFVQRLHRAGWAAVNTDSDAASNAAENDREDGATRTTNHSMISLVVALMTGPPESVILDIGVDEELKKEK